VSLGNYYGGGSGPSWTDLISCGGDETSLSECVLTGHHYYCSHTKDISIICDNSKCIQYTNKLSAVGSRAHHMSINGLPYHVIEIASTSLHFSLLMLSLHDTLAINSALNLMTKFEFSVFIKMHKTYVQWVAKSLSSKWRQRTKRTTEVNNKNTLFLYKNELMLSKVFSTL